MVNFILFLFFFRTIFIRDNEGMNELPEQIISHKPILLYEKKVILDKLQDPFISQYDKLKIIKENQHLFDKSYKKIFDDIWDL
jgi:hypothetical protein